jgi:hypothetical protein
MGNKREENKAIKEENSQEERVAKKLRNKISSLLFKTSGCM